MAFQTVADFEALTGDEALTPAEIALIAACRAGEFCWLGGERPNTDTPARRIRASLLRLLIVGGSDDCRLSERGVVLLGAWISGELNLDFEKGCGSTTMAHCHFSDQLKMNSARLSNFNLTGSKLPGLFAQGIKVAQDVFLRNGFHATRTVTLNGAEIGGQLVCTQGRFDGNGGNALNGQNATVGGKLVWRTNTIHAGMVDLDGAKVGELNDDLASWPDDPEMLSLDGFTYDRIASFTDTEQRLEWLKRGAHWPGLFYPQPYVQLAKALRAQGHIREARKVAYEAEKHSRRHENRLLQIIPNGDVLVGLNSIWRDIKRTWFWGWSWILRLTVGYGLYPIRSIAALVLLIGIAWGLAYLTWTQGGMVPNSGPVLVSEGWLSVADTPHAAKTWIKADPGRDWETFSSFAWAADLVIPIVDLGQTAAWAPSTERGPYGANLWWVRWGLITLGWIVSALGAAAITGINRRE
jgi:hypothetical protein